MSSHFIGSLPLHVDADFANANATTTATLTHFMSSPDSMSSPYSSTSDLAMQSLASSSLSSASSNGDSQHEATTPPAATASSANAGEVSTEIKHKPHKCDVCGSSFARKVHLQRHSLRHQVCKPYCCERCGKCFSRQDSLVRHHRLLHDGVTSSSAAASVDDKKTLAKKAAKRASTGSIMTATAPACLRCSSAAAPCDGQQPCARCTANQGAESCCYASASASPNKRARRRHDSVATSASSASMLTEDDEWASVHGVRRHTTSSVSSASTSMSELMSPVSSIYGLENAADALSASSLWGMQQQQAIVVQPHPFELPLQDSLLMTGFGGSNDVKSLHPQQLHDGGALPFDVSLSAAHMPHLLSMLSTNEQQQTAPFSQTVMPMFDWTTLLHGHQEQQQQQQQQQLHLQQQQLLLLQQHVQAQANAAATKQPFTGAASNKGLNATLLGGHDSSFPSPSLYGMQNAHLLAAQQQQAAAYTPSNLTINLPASLSTMSADNWDGFMRQLSGAYGGAASTTTTASAGVVA